MTAVGFGAAVINHYLPFVEHTYYERVIADTMLCFLAEAQAPKVSVYRGANWASLMDAYIAHHTGQRGGLLTEILVAFQRKIQGLRDNVEEKCRATASEIAALDAAHPDYRDAFMANYERGLRDSGLELSAVPFLAFLRKN